MYENNPVFTANPTQPLAKKKSHRGLIVIITIIVLLLLSVVVIFFVIFSPASPKETKVGEANNGGPGDILIATATTAAENETVENRYRISTDGVLYEAPDIEFKLTDEGLPAIPLSCIRTAFSGKASDEALCDNDSRDPNQFGSRFFSELRYALYDAFDEPDLKRKIMPLRIFKSSNRTFLNLIRTRDNNGNSNILMEYKDGALIETVAFDQETIQWAEATGGQ